MNSADRYSRQTRFAPLGKEGQQRLTDSRVAVCGCGALGSVLAETLTRAGVGFVRIIDRDFVELNNLQRQVLFDEADCKSGLPKAEAAARKLRFINSSITIEPAVTDLDCRNIAHLCGDVDLILDGTDNFETRFLINDFAALKKIPWVYGGCLGSEGQSMTVLPGTTACFACLMSTAPPPGSTATCETAGILGPVVQIVASFQATEAIKILSGNVQAINRDLFVIDVWENRTRRINLTKLRETGRCRVCHDRRFDWLEGRAISQSARLCGRNAVQIVPATPHAVDFDALVARFGQEHTLVRNRYLARFALADCELTVFDDGRAVIKGTDDLAEARTLYARYLGG